MIKLSIIIPVYNVEKYIGRCLDSCIKQDLPLDEYEILVVNDGSMDESIEIVRRYAEQYQNIRIVEQKNAGPSVARNRGIKEAKGEYLWFIDSDDDISENVVGMLLHEAYQYKLDAICFDINVINSGTVSAVYPAQPDKDKIICSGKVFFCGVAMPASACVAFFRKEFLISNFLTFKEGISHEDYEFTPRAYCLADRIMYVNLPVYNYWVREGSRQTATSIMVQTQKTKDWLVICDSLYLFTKEHFEEGSAAYNTMIGKVNFAFSQSLRNYTKGVSTIAEYKEKPYYPLDISVEGETRNRWKYKLINFSIPLYLMVHNVLKR